ncbi:hypothetical protein I8H83_04600 [Candidatus Saccharibacteria bacterium]|nr:hypothetical protein [Candidatus Saccharibacteria bacterium]
MSTMTVQNCTTRGGALLPKSIVLVDEHITDVHIKELRATPHLKINQDEELLLLNWKQESESLKSAMNVMNCSLVSERACRHFAEYMAERLMPDDGSAEVRAVVYSHVTRSYPEVGNAQFRFIPEAIRRRRRSLGLSGIHSQWILYRESLQQLW